MDQQTLQMLLALLNQQGLSDPGGGAGFGASGFMNTPPPVPGAPRMTRTVPQLTLPQGLLQGLSTLTLGRELTQGLFSMAAMGGGMSPYESEFARQMTQRQYATYIQQAHQQHGQRMLGMFEGIGGRLGLDLDLGLSDGNLGFLGEMAAGPMGQMLLGGDPLAFERAAFSTRMHAGRTGDLFNPYDEAAMGRASEYAENLSGAWRDRFYGEGALPDPVSMRGFTTDEHAGIHRYMVGAGFRHGGVDMRDLDGDIEEQMDYMEETVEALSALSDVLGVKGAELIEAAERFTGGEFNVADPRRVRQAADRMLASSIALRVDPDMYGAYVMRTGREMDAVTGLARDIGGRAVGGAFSMEMAEDQAFAVMSMGRAMGLSTPEQFEELHRTHTARTAQLVSSSRGRDLAAIMLARQAGMVHDAEIAEWQTALAEGAPGAADALQDQMVSRLFGSASEARRAMRDPEVRARLMSTMDESTRETFFSELYAGAGGELASTGRAIAAREGISSIISARRELGLGTTSRSDIEEARLRAAKDGATEQQRADMDRIYAERGWSGVSSYLAGEDDGGGMLARADLAELTLRAEGIDIDQAGFSGELEEARRLGVISQADVSRLRNIGRDDLGRARGDLADRMAGAGGMERLTTSRLRHIERAQRAMQHGEDARHIAEQLEETGMTPFELALGMERDIQGGELSRDAEYDMRRRLTYLQTHLARTDAGAMGAQEWQYYFGMVEDDKEALHKNLEEMLKGITGTRDDSRITAGEFIPKAMRWAAGDINTAGFMAALGMQVDDDVRAFLSSGAGRDEEGRLTADTLRAAIEDESIEVPEALERLVSGPSGGILGAAAEMYDGMMDSLKGKKEGKGGASTKTEVEGEIKLIGPAGEKIAEALLKLLEAAGDAE